MLKRSLQVTTYLRHLTVLLLCAFLGVGQAGAGSMTLLGVGGPAAATGCPAATNFLARNGNADSANMTTLICGLVTDGIITGTLAGAAGCGTVLDGLYIIPTDTAAHANLNLCGTNFTLTGATPPTFTANQCYAPNGTTQFLDTGFVPSTAGGAMLQNSASEGVYVRGGRTTGNGSIAIGAANGSVLSYIGMLSAASTANVDLNGASFPNVTLPSNIADGFMSVTRQGGSAATALAVYKNGSSTAIGTPADGSAGLPPFSFFLAAQNNSGTAGSFTTDQICAVYFGAGITGAQHLALSNRINAFMQAKSLNVY